MITIYKTTNNVLSEIKEPEKGCWINVVNPTKEELEDLAGRLNIYLDFLTDALDIDESARLETENGDVLIVLRAPRLNEENSAIPFITLPVGIILSQEMIITVCVKEVEAITDFLNGKVKNFNTENRSRFILKTFLRASVSYLNYLKEINNQTAATERELHKASRNEELIKLLDLEKSLVFFTTSLKSNELMMERLQKSEAVKLEPEDNDLLEDVIIETRQAVEMANIYSNILSGMMDAFASVISNNLNVVLKFLTAVTIILMLPTLVASVYGMNVKLPFQDSLHAFTITVIISFVLAGLATIIFVKRRWF